MRHRGRFVALILAAGLLASACGSRVVPLSQGQVPDGQGGFVDPGTVASPGAPGGGAANPSAGPLVPGGSQTTGPVTPGGSQTTGPKASTCAATRATDVGVTKDEIKLGLVASITGPLPGQFNSAVEAVDTYFKMVNGEMGGICGRRVRLLIRDDNGNGQRNLAVSRELANEDKVFAFVGSVSAPDDSGIGVVSREQKIPDIGFPLTFKRSEAPYTYGVPGQLQRNLIGQGAAGSAWLNREYDIEQIAIFWLDESDVSIMNAFAFEAAMMKASGGRIRVCYEQATTVLDNNFTSYAVKMKGKCKPQEKTAVYTTMENSSNVKLATAMRDQGFKPAVFAPTFTSYLPSFISDARGATEGAFLAMPQIPFERCRMLGDGRPAPPCSHAELNRYVQSLHRYNPGFRIPGSFGGPGWGIAMLFHEVALKCGANLTRACVLRELEAMPTFSANGFLSPTRPRDREIYHADIIVQVRGNRFVELPRPSGMVGPPGAEDFWDKSQVFDWWKYYCANKSKFPNTAHKDKYIRC